MSTQGKKAVEKVRDTAATQVNISRVLVEMMKEHKSNWTEADIEGKLPSLYAHEKASRPTKAYVKLFSPYSNWTWYLSEYDPKERVCFALVKGFELEYGYVSVDELLSLQANIERDTHFEPMILADIRIKILNGGHV